MKYALSVFALSILLSSVAQTPAVWQDYLDAKENGTKSILLDYSYAGYDFSRSEIPDVSTWTYFDVTDYGAVADDEGYDDEGIQAAIAAAEGSGAPGVVFFPSGRFIVSSDNDVSKYIKIGTSNIVLKGSGSGDGGTEIFMDKMRVANGHWQFEFAPSDLNTSGLTDITESVSRGDRVVAVSDPTELSVGQSIHIRHTSEEFARAHFGDLELSSDWSRLFGSTGGMNVYEPHIIDKIEGDQVTFENPVQTDLPKLTTAYQIRNLQTISEVGVEDILFTSNWENYGEAFVHHKDDIHDYAWSAIQFEYVQNAWLRNCEFRSWSEVVDIRQSIAVTIENVLLSGEKGHASFLTRRSYGVLVKDCIDSASQHHGPGTGYAGVNTVYLRCQMNEDQSVDSHSGQPYATLIDDVQGGAFDRNGGPHEGYPHHARDLVFWNFRHDASESKIYDFWRIARNGNTYADPFFIGFQSDEAVTFINEGLNQSPGVMVEPRSLFEAQLNLRLSRESSFPEVTFVSPQSGIKLEKGASVAVEVSATDPDGTIDFVELLVNDELVRRISSAPFVWGEEANMDPKLFALTAGSYELRAAATDNDGNVTNSVISIFVGSEPVVSFLRPEETKIIETGDHVEVEIIASDSDGSISSVELYMDDVLISTKSEAPFVWGTDAISEPSLFNLQLGSYLLDAIVTDDDGLTSSANRTFVVNKAPNISFSIPVSGTTFDHTANIKVDVGASDDDGSIAQVKLYLNGEFLRSEVSSPYTWGFTQSIDPKLFDMEGGTYWLKGEALDNLNRSAFDSVMVIVESVPLHTSSVSTAPWVFPNPVIDKISMMINSNISEVVLVDINGQTIEITYVISDQVMTVSPTETLSAGLYFLKYVDEKGTSIFKILK